MKCKNNNPFLFFMINKIIKNILSYMIVLRTIIIALCAIMIKLDISIVYILSRTPFFAVWLLLLIFGLFGGGGSNLVNLYCLFIVAYINGTACILFVICNIKKTRTWVVNLVGTTFLGKFVPNKGFSNLLVLILPNLAFVVIEIVSMKYETNYKFEECERLFQAFLDFKASGDSINADKIYQKQLQLFRSIQDTPGL